MKLDCLPFDKVDFAKVLSVLAERKFIIKYFAAGCDYGYIPSWKNHQVINAHEAQSKLPDPEECDKETDARACTEKNMQGLYSQNITQATRDTVYAKDGNKCLRCNSTSDLTVDHIFPRSIGGTNAITNLRTLCRACNSARPVAGAEFIEDLKRDGLTLDDMKCTCMHVHAHEMHVHARGEGKGREGKGRERKGKEGNMEQRVVDAWNSTTGIIQIRKLDLQRKLHLKTRLSETSWPWEEALKKFPLLCFSDGKWTPTFDWFIRPGTAYKIVEGSYNFRPSNGNGIKPKQRDTYWDKYGLDEESGGNTVPEELDGSL